MNQKENGQLSRMEEKIDTIIRGVYGDPENNVDGLIQRQADDEAWREEKGEIIDDYEDKRSVLGSMIAERSFILKFWPAVILGGVGVVIFFLNQFNIINF